MGSVSTIDLQEGGTLMNCEKCIGLDVHQATISVAVMDPMGKVIMESDSRRDRTPLYTRWNLCKHNSDTEELRL